MVTQKHKEKRERRRRRRWFSEGRGYCEAESFAV